MDSTPANDSAPRTVERIDTARRNEGPPQSTGLSYADEEDIEMNGEHNENAEQSIDNNESGTQSSNKKRKAIVVEEDWADDVEDSFYPPAHPISYAIPGNDFSEVIPTMVKGLTHIADWTESVQEKYPSEMAFLLQEIAPLCERIINARGLPRQQLPEPNGVDARLIAMFHSINRDMTDIKLQVANLRKGPAPIPHIASRPTNYPTASSNANNKQSFAAVAASVPMGNAAPDKQPKAKKKTNPLPKNERLIIRFQGDPIPVEQRKKPLVITTEINARFSITPTAKDLVVIGATWNQAGNCILTFSPGTSARSIDAHAGICRDIVDPLKPAIVSRDVKWSRVVVHRVLTGKEDVGSLFTPEKLMQELACNPSIRKLHIRRMLDWIRKPETIESIHSSISFAFEDPTGANLSTILKQRIFMFGDMCPVKEWKDKPSISQCHKCWNYGHSTAGCIRKVARCRLCGESHKEDDHRSKCSHCVKAAAPQEVECNYRYCLNCKGSHAADDSGCPTLELKKAFRGPSTSDGWKIVAHSQRNIPNL
jgi:hypothetical protein